MLEIAVYGKGGIGKSTVSANLSAALAMRGRAVLQIGCDPKHDSTQLLMHGERTRTVLDYLRTVSKEEEDPGEVLHRGAYGVGCIEAGGPRPGVGCAGRGIITAFEFLSRHRVKDAFDTIVYDVLGDVVCGGFAVPVRREYADVVFLVTSGEFMAIYAANNILRGIRNFDSDQVRRVAGIIYNERRLPGEDARVRRFAQAVGLPVCVKVPRSEGFARAEESKHLLMELDGYDAEKEVFRILAERIGPDMPLYEARPLEDEALEEIVLHGASSETTGAEAGASDRGASAMRVSAVGVSARSGSAMSAPVLDSSAVSERTGSGHLESSHPGKVQPEIGVPADDPAGRSPEEEVVPVPTRMRMPLYGCAFNGAATTAVHLTDAIVIAHGPSACAFYTLQNITSTGRKNLFNRGILMPSALSPHFESTDIGQAEAVFGGTELLREKVRAAVERRPGAVVVISSCVSGIIGDDVHSVEDLSTPDTKVIVIDTDGVLAGDYMAGIRLCMDTLSDALIDPDVRPEGRFVNLINETGVSNQIERNFRTVQGILSRLDVAVNCRYLGDASVEQMRSFLRAPLNILATENEDSLNLRRRLEERYGCRFLDGALPVGFENTCDWVRRIGAFFDRQEAAQQIIEEERVRYLREIGELKKDLEGKTVLLTTINAGLDWLLEAAGRAGMRFVWIGVLNYLHQELCVTKSEEYRALIDDEYDWQKVRDKIRQLRPDLVLSNYTSVMEDGDYVQDAIPMMPEAGFQSALPVLRRWAKQFVSGKEGAWKNDRSYFDGYFS